MQVIDKLIQDFVRPGWNLTPVFELKLLIADVPSPKAAKQTVRAYTEFLAASAANLGFESAVVRHPGLPPGEYAYSISARMANYQGTEMNQIPVIATPGLQISELKLSTALLPTIIRFIENPEMKGGIIRIPDERQIALTEASAALVTGTDLVGATQRKRSDYWFLPDLERMRLLVNETDSEFEFAFQGTNEQQSTWHRFTNRYWKVRDEFGAVYQCFENLGMDAITTPVSA